MKTFFRSTFLIFVGFARALSSSSARIVKMPSWNLSLCVAVSFLKAFIKSHCRDFATLRAITDFRILPTVPLGADFFITYIENVSVEIVFPRDFKIQDKSALRSHRVILYLHGGGGALCSPVTHRILTHSLAVESEAIVVVPKYRRVPESTFLDAVQDAYNVLKGLINSQFVKGSNLCICGDSAGGAIALLTLVRLREEGFPRFPACMGLLSPWSDFHSLPSVPETDVDYLCPEILEFMGRMIQSDTNPVNHSFTGFPPTLVQSGGSELLAEQIRSLVRKLISESGESRIRFIQYEDMIHIPHLFSSLNSVGKEAMSDLACFVKINTPL